MLDICARCYSSLTTLRCASCPRTMTNLYCEVCNPVEFERVFENGPHFCSVKCRRQAPVQQEATA